MGQRPAASVRCVALARICVCLREPTAPRRWCVHSQHKRRVQTHTCNPLPNPSFPPHMPVCPGARSHRRAHASPAHVPGSRPAAALKKQPAAWATLRCRSSPVDPRSRHARLSPCRNSGPCRAEGHTRMRVKRALRCGAEGYVRTRGGRQQCMRKHRGCFRGPACL